MSTDLAGPTIGIDGGGTNCRLALLRDGRRYDVVTGSANASTDLAGTICTLQSGLEELADMAGLQRPDLSGGRAFVGLAGIMGREEALAIAKALPFAHIAVEDDRRSTLAGALGGGDGAVAGIGTGSFVARRHRGADRFVGGWGLALNDTAAGGWLGKSLLGRTVRSVDGMADATPLTREMLDQYGGATGIVRFSLTARPDDFARLAPRVVDAAARGDATATDLMREGGAYIQAALGALGWQPGETLCLVGGLGRHYAPYLEPAVARSLAEPRGTALDGALELASHAEGRP